MIRKIHSLRRRFAPISLALLAGFFVVIFAPASRAQESTSELVQIDPARTTIEFSLSGNFHTVHGKFALKNGAIHFDPATGKIDGAIVVDARSGESGNGGRDGRMHREILESAKFPEIVFTPTHMAGAMAAEGASKLEISGRFGLHGQEHDVTLPVEIKSSGGNLQISAHLEIPYVQWGMKNPSNFLLRVSDKVEIEIRGAGRVLAGDGSRP